MRFEVKDFKGYYGIKSITHDEWMYVGPNLDDQRRHLLTYIGKGEADESMVKNSANRSSVTLGETWLGECMRFSLHNVYELERVRGWWYG